MYCALLGGLELPHDVRSDNLHVEVAQLLEGPWHVLYSRDTCLFSTVLAVEPASANAVSLEEATAQARIHLCLRLHDAGGIEYARSDASSHYTLSSSVTMETEAGCAHGKQDQLAQRGGEGRTAESPHGYEVIPD